jgi:DNA helicase-2/ATP-dependent DNA helicase PcrA
MNITKVFGPPGTGKTTFLLDVVDQAIRTGTPPERIAYVAFTKRAAEEAASRAMSRFGLTKEQLLWFRTLHSMAFKTLGMSRDDVMQEHHEKELCYEMGFQFSPAHDIAMVRTGKTLGDKVAIIQSLSRLRGVTIEQQWEECNFHDCLLEVAKQWHFGLQRYKATHGLVDYTDMLEQFNTVLDVDLFILDEAQDLSPLQWQVVHRASANAKNFYLAGDDDQSIYDWAGATPEAFINHPGKSLVLPQSFRIPRAIQSIAQGVSARIRVRQEKQWYPREAEGKIYRIGFEDAVSLKEGSWLLLARNHRQLSRFESMVQQQGYSYLKEGNHSTSGSLSRAIVTWEQWRKGKQVDIKNLKTLKNYVDCLEEWNPGKTVIAIEDSPAHHLAEYNWMQALSVPLLKKEYLRSCLANGENLFADPRITISTIHRAKGGEADHVILITDLTREQWEQQDTDSELRVLYVALTRAKETLTIIDAQSLSSYRL